MTLSVTLCPRAGASTMDIGVAIGRIRTIFEHLWKSSDKRERFTISADVLEGNLTVVTCSLVGKVKKSGSVSHLADVLFAPSSEPPSADTVGRFACRVGASKSMNDGSREAIPVPEFSLAARLGAFGLSSLTFLYEKLKFRRFRSHVACVKRTKRNCARWLQRRLGVEGSELFLGTLPHWLAKGSVDMQFESLEKVVQGLARTHSRLERLLECNTEALRDLIAELPKLQKLLRKNKGRGIYTDLHAAFGGVARVAARCELPKGDLAIENKHRWSGMYCRMSAYSCGC